MNQCVNEQMATCKHAEELAIDHMCDPCEWMPVPRVKSGKRPGESRERNTAIHHWVLLDIRKVIESDEAMPYHLRINPKCDYRQTEQDEKIGSLECCNVADLESFRRVRSLAAVKPAAFRFCAVRLAMPFARLSDRQNAQIVSLKLFRDRSSLAPWLDFWPASCESRTLQNHSMGTGIIDPGYRKQKRPAVTVRFDN